MDLALITRGWLLISSNLFGPHARTESEFELLNSAKSYYTNIYSSWHNKQLQIAQRWIIALQSLRLMIICRVSSFTIFSFSLINYLHKFLFYFPTLRTTNKEVRMIKKPSSVSDGGAASSCSPAEVITKAKCNRPARLRRAFLEFFHSNVIKLISRCKAMV